MKQKYTSKDTSINTINKVYKQKEFEDGSTILDYGGGKYDSNAVYMKEKGCKLYVYDKFNRSDSHNENVIKKMLNNPPDYLVCSNVLNVIYENEIIMEILEDIQKYKATKIFFAIYEGNKSGIGKETSKGWQRNEKTSAYISIIDRYFNIISIGNQIIECVPKQNLY